MNRKHFGVLQAVPAAAGVLFVMGNFLRQSGYRKITDEMCWFCVECVLVFLTGKGQAAEAITL